jgi:hypothetical protein
VEYNVIGEGTGGGSYYIHVGPNGAHEACLYSLSADKWTCKAKVLTEIWTNDFLTDESAVFLEASENWGRNQATTTYVSLQVAECLYSLRRLTAQDIVNACTTISPRLP